MSGFVSVYLVRGDADDNVARRYGIYAGGDEVRAIRSIFGSYFGDPWITSACRTASRSPQTVGYSWANVSS
jgi:hypothetical protein